MKRNLLLATVSLLGVAACVPPQPAAVFIPSKKSAVELRMMQSRVVEGDQNTVMRDVIATLQDLSYRITKADAGSGTVSATRLTGLRLAAVVRENGPAQSVVRANATVLRPREEAQVDDPQFYLQNFFGPLGDTAGRQLRAVPEDEIVPEAVRPTAEVLPGARKAQGPAANAPAGADAGTTPTGKQ